MVFDFEKPYFKSLVKLWMAFLVQSFEWIFCSHHKKNHNNFAVFGKQMLFHFKCEWPFWRGVPKGSIVAGLCKQLHSHRKSYPELKRRNVSSATILYFWWQINAKGITQREIVSWLKASVLMCDSICIWEVVSITMLFSNKSGEKNLRKMHTCIIQKICRRYVHTGGGGGAPGVCQQSPCQPMMVTAWHSTHVWISETFTQILRPMHFDMVKATLCVFSNNLVNHLQENIKFLKGHFSQMSMTFDFELWPLRKHFFIHVSPYLWHQILLTLISLFLFSCFDWTQC